MTETSYRFEYIPPGTVRGDDLNGFILLYYEDAKQMMFLGRLPDGDNPGYVDFPSESSWTDQVPEWANERRKTIESRLLEYTPTNSSLKWVSSNSFAPCPRLHPLPTEADIRESKAVAQAMRAKYPAAHKIIMTTQRTAVPVFELLLAAVILTGLYLLWR